MDYPELMQLIDQEWVAFIHTLGSVPITAFDQPAFDGWSLKDLVGHITTWEEDSLRAVLSWAQGQDHTPLNTDPAWTLDAFNAEQVERKRAVPLVVLLNELGAAHARLVSLLALLPPATFTGDRLDKLTGDTWHHYKEHRGAIERWLADQDTSG